MKKQTIFKNTARLLVAVLLLVGVNFAPHKAQAASLTSMRAIASRLAQNTNSNYTIYFVSPTGIQSGEVDTIVLTFSSDFTLAAEAAVNFDFAVGDSGTCTTASYTEETLALTASATEWGVDVTGDVVTFTPETDDTHAGGLCYRIQMGTSAVSGGTGAASTVQNGPLDDDDQIDFSGDFDDTGTIYLDIISNDQITISASVAPSITFTISTGDNAIGFGTLTSAAGRWADAAEDGEVAVAGNLPTSAHQGSVATNSSGGWVLSYNGATLTAAGGTIDPLGTPVDEDSDGTPGVEQFGLAVSTNGNSTITTGYSRDSNSDFAFVASTTTTIISEVVPTATETLDFSYLANILGSTDAGAYSTTLTYIMTGTF